MLRTLPDDVTDSGEVELDIDVAKEADGNSVAEEA